MDVYSLGLLCFWMLFHDVGLDTSLFQIEAHDWKDIQTVGQLFDNTALVEQLKVSGQLREIACHVCQKASLVEEKRHGLLSFLRATLALQPQERCLNVRDLEPSLAEELCAPLSLTT